MKRRTFIASVIAGIAGGALLKEAEPDGGYLLPKEYESSLAFSFLGQCSDGRWLAVRDGRTYESWDGATWSPV